MNTTFWIIFFHCVCTVFAIFLYLLNLCPHIWNKHIFSNLKILYNIYTGFWHFYIVFFLWQLYNECHNSDTWSTCAFSGINLFLFMYCSCVWHFALTNASYYKEHHSFFTHIFTYILLNYMQSCFCDLVYSQTLINENQIYAKNKFDPTQYWPHCAFIVSF